MNKITVAHVFTDKINNIGMPIANNYELIEDEIDEYKDEKITTVFIVEDVK